MINNYVPPAEQEPSVLSENPDVIELLGRSGPSHLGAETRSTAGSFISVAKRHELLSQEQEHELARLLYVGRQALRTLERREQLPPTECDQLEAQLATAQEARRVLIEHNLRLVIDRAQLFYSSHVALAERISIGNLALIRAVDTFDYRLDTRISTFAASQIEFAIRHASRGERRYRGIFTDEEEGRLLKIEAVRQQMLTQEQPISFAEITRRTGIPVKEVSDLLGRRAAGGRLLSIEAIDEYDSQPLAERLPDPNDAISSYQNEAEQKSRLREAWRRLANILSEREYDITRRYIVESLTQDKIAEQEGLSRKLIGQILKSASRKITELTGEPIDLAHLGGKRPQANDKRRNESSETEAKEDSDLWMAPETAISPQPTEPPAKPQLRLVAAVPVEEPELLEESEEVTRQQTESTPTPEVLPVPEHPSALLLSMAFAQSGWAEQVRQSAQHASKNAAALLRLLTNMAGYTPEPAHARTLAALQACVDSDTPEALLAALGVTDWSEAREPILQLVSDLELQLWQLAEKLPLVPRQGESTHDRLNNALAHCLAEVLATRSFELDEVVRAGIEELPLGKQDKKALSILAGAHFSAAPDAPAVYVEAPRLQKLLEQMAGNYQSTADATAHRLVKDVLGVDGDPQSYRQALRLLLQAQSDLDAADIRLRFEAALRGESTQKVSIVEEDFDFDDETDEDEDRVAPEDRPVNGEQVFEARVRRVPLLGVEQEIELAKKVEAGREAAALLQGDLPAGTDRRELERLKAEGERAKERFVESNIRLVFKKAQGFRRRLAIVAASNANSITMDDIKQQGLFGLMRAVEKFDYRKGYKFSTYAMHWIRQAIERYLDQESLAVHLPADVAQGANKARSMLGAMSTKLGRTPTEQELLEALEAEYRPGLARNILTAMRLKIQSGDQAISDEEGSKTLFDILPEQSETPPFDTALTYSEANQTYEQIQALLEPQEWRILSATYGLDGGGPRQQAQVVEELGIGRGAVTYGLKSALAKIHSQPGLLDDLRQRLQDLDEES